MYVTEGVPFSFVRNVSLGCTDTLKYKSFYFCENPLVNNVIHISKSPVFGVTEGLTIDRLVSVVPFLCLLSQLKIALIEPGKTLFRLYPKP